MNFTTTRTVLIAALFLGAAPAFAEGTVVVSPDGTTAVPLDAPTIVAPGSTVIVQPGDAVVVTQSAPINVGLVGIVAWGTTTKGPAWVDIKGMPLYIYEQDAASKSVCNADCAVSWPPLAAKQNDQGVDEWTVIARDDGSKQWAFRGHPLYTFVKDATPGEVNGDGAAGFHLAN